MWENSGDNLGVVVVEPLDLGGRHHGVVDQLGLEGHQGDGVELDEGAWLRYSKEFGS